MLLLTHKPLVIFLSHVQLRSDRAAFVGTCCAGRVSPPSRRFISAFCLWEFDQSWKYVLLLLLSLLHREKAWQVWNHKKNWAVTENWTRYIQSFKCFMFLLPGKSSTCCPQPELLFAAVTGSSFIIRANLSTFPIFFLAFLACTFSLSSFPLPSGKCWLCCF